MTNILAGVVAVLAVLLLGLRPMVSQAATDANMRALFDQLVNNAAYSSRVRPIRDTGLVLTLTVDLFLVGINEVNEVEQKVKSTGYLKIEWSDTFMTWTSATYGGITKFMVPQENIWKPDLALANAYDTVSGLGDKFMYLEITNAGVIIWRPYQVFDSTCTLDMTYFPFDQQTCEIQLVTWSSTSEMINILLGTDGFNIGGYETNSNWDLLSVEAYNSSTTTTAGISFSFKIKRKPLFYLITFIIPVILLALLNIFVFILPADSGEKTGYAIVLFLTFAIFLLIVTDTMPEGMNTVPIISIYLLLELVLSTAMLFLTIVQLRLHNQGDDVEVPGFYKFLVRKVFSLQSKLCLTGEVNKGEGTPEPNKRKATPDSRDGDVESMDKDAGKSKKGKKQNFKSKVAPSDSAASLVSIQTQASEEKTGKTKTDNESKALTNATKKTAPAAPKFRTERTELLIGGPPLMVAAPNFPTANDLEELRNTPLLLRETDSPTSSASGDATTNDEQNLITSNSPSTGKDKHKMSNGHATGNDKQKMSNGHATGNDKQKPITANGTPRPFPGKQSPRTVALFSTQFKTIPMDITQEPEDEKKDGDTDSEEISWSDVCTALDIVFFCIFSVINTIVTGVAFIVTATGGSSQ